jgi:hypothetical protein
VTVEKVSQPGCRPGRSCVCLSRQPGLLDHAEADRSLPVSRFGSVNRDHSTGIDLESGDLLAVMDSHRLLRAHGRANCLCLTADRRRPEGHRGLSREGSNAAGGLQVETSIRGIGIERGPRAEAAARRKSQAQRDRGGPHVGCLQEVLEEPKLYSGGG